MQFSKNSSLFIFFFLLIDRALSGATILGQSGPGSNGNEGVLRIPQSYSIIGTSPAVCLVSYPGHCSWCILQPYHTGQYLFCVKIKRAFNFNADL